MSLSLLETQEVFQKAILDFSGQSWGDVPVKGDLQLTRLERVNIYHEDWWIRLTERLSFNFKECLESIGEIESDQVEAILKEYLIDFCPAGQVIMFIGDDLPGFLELKGFSARTVALASVCAEKMHIRYGQDPLDWDQSQIGQFFEQDDCQFRVEENWTVIKVPDPNEFRAEFRLLIRPHLNVETEQVDEVFFQRLEQLRNFGEISLESLGELFGNSFQESLTRLLRWRVLSPKTPRNRRKLS